MSENKETKLCKHCQSEMPKKAKVCPTCRKKQGGKLKWILVALVVICILGAAAGGDDEEKEQASANVRDTGTEISGETADEKDTAAEENTGEITFEEIVAVDNEECMIKISEIDPDNMWGYTLKAQLENKSSDKTYMFSVESASINGVKCDPLFAAEVAAGKKANEEISFSDNTLKENGITDYTDIELTFRVYESNDWMADVAAKETIHVYPYGEDKATVFVREAQPSDNVLIDNEDVTVIVTGYEEDAIWGYTVNLYLVNKTDTEVMFSVDEASVNGYMADPFYAVSVGAGKCAFSSMSWPDTTLEENGIDEVEEIEILLKAYDAENWLDDNFANEVIILNP